MSVYPSHRYHPERGSRIVKSADDDSRLEGWFHSPADFGVETEPGKEPDPVILAKAESVRRKPGRPKKIEPKDGDKPQ